MIDKQDNQKRTVLIGLTGGIDSAVAAYLLKRQGYNVIGVGVLFDYLEDDGTEKGMENLGDGIYFIKDIRAVESVCNQLDIPFYAVNAQERFKAEVLDFVLSAKLGGYHFHPEVYATNTIIKVLISKMSSLGADSVATGHYAKIHFNQESGVYEICASNDLDNDQSFYLYSLMQEDLQHLILPLSAMRVSGTKKIADTIDLSFVQEKMSAASFMKNPNLAKYVEERSPYSLINNGSVSDYFSDVAMSDHDGVHHFYLGEPDIREDSNIDDDLVAVSISMSSGRVLFMSKNKMVPITRVMLSRCVYDPELDISKPLDVYVKFSVSGEMIPAAIYFLNNKKIYCELRRSYADFLFSGDIGVIYDGLSSGSRLIAGGLVSKMGHIDGRGELRLLPEQSTLLGDEEQSNYKEDIYALKF